MLAHVNELVWGGAYTDFREGILLFLVSALNVPTNVLDDVKYRHCQDKFENSCNPGGWGPKTEKSIFKYIPPHKRMTR